MSRAILALMCAPLLMGGACEKKAAKASDTGAVAALDRAEGGGGQGGAVDTTPLQGVELGKLSDAKQQVFYKLIGSLSSPCGKAHSLRTSYASDTACKRAPFAVRYVVALLEDEATEAQLREMYDAKYKAAGKPVKLDVSKAPRTGADDAPIRLVEFFDYQCPHCAAVKPVLDQVMDAHQGKVVLYYMMYPLPKHTDAKSAAQAALAAHQLGKFKDMHALLFASSPRHARAHVIGYARQLGLDPAAFEAAYDAAAAQVGADIQQGDAAGVEATPTLFFNDRKYEGPLLPRYLEMWIAEELAVNR